MLVSVGAAAISWDKIKETVDELVSKGDISADEGKKLYNELTARAEEQGRSMDERMRAEIRQVLTNLGVADRTQIAVLESRIEAIESRMNALEGKCAGHEGGE
jgi:polyhydroxyalkanoate synthesis regulator phasin